MAYINHDFFEYGSPHFNQIPLAEIIKFCNLHELHSERIMKLFSTEYECLEYEDQKRRCHYFSLWYGETNGVGYPEAQTYDLCPVKNRVTLSNDVDEYSFHFGEEIKCESTYSIAFHGNVKPKFSRLELLQKYDQWLIDTFNTDDITYQSVPIGTCECIKIMSDENGIYVIDPIYSFLRECENREITAADIARIYHVMLRKSPHKASHGTQLAIGGFSYISEKTLVNVAMSNGLTRLCITPHLGLFPFTVTLLKHMTDETSLCPRVQKQWPSVMRLNGLSSTKHPKEEFDTLSSWIDLHRQLVPTIIEPDRSGLMFLLDLAENKKVYDDINMVNNQRECGELVIGAINSYDEFAKRYREKGNEFVMFIPVLSIYSGVLEILKQHYENFEIRARTDYNYKFGIMVTFSGPRVLNRNVTLDLVDYSRISAHYKRYIIHLCQAYDIQPPEGFVKHYIVTDFNSGTPISFFVDLPYSRCDVDLVERAGTITINSARGDTFVLSNTANTNTIWFASIRSDGQVNLIGDIKKYISFSKGQIKDFVNGVKKSTLKRFNRVDPIELLTTLYISQTKINNYHYGIQTVCNMHSQKRIILRYEPRTGWFSVEPKTNYVDPGFKVPKSFSINSLLPTYQSNPITNSYVHEKFGYPVLNPKINYLYDRVEKFKNQCDEIYSA